MYGAGTFPAGKTRDFMMPPQRKHERPLARRIQCLRRLKLKTTETNRGGRIGATMRYGCCKDEWCRGNQLTRQGENHHVWHSQRCKLGMAEALISGGRLLQAAIGIDPFGAVIGVICVCECHDRRKRRHGACLSRIDQLTEQHRADQQTTQGTTQSVDSAKHIEQNGVP